MGQALAGSGWQGGYRIIGILQVVLTVVLLFSLPLWKLPQDAMGGAPVHPAAPQLSGAAENHRCAGSSSLLFVLLRTGIHRRMWASSYCTLVRGLDAQMLPAGPACSIWALPPGGLFPAF